MATLSSLGSMMLNLQPQFKDYNTALLEGQRLQAGRTQQETALLALADLKRSQEAQAAARQFIQEHPEFVLGGGMPMLATLQGAPGGGPPGPITQQAFGPGGTVGPPQTIAAPMQPNATLGPQSTIAALAPQPQMPNPQERLLAMARQNPEAALMLQQRMQAQQDRQWTMEEKRLEMGAKVSEAVARQLQGVTDQASLDAARERIRLIHPQAATQVPQFYSKEAVESIQQRGIAIADKAKWDLDRAKARQTTQMTELLPGMMTQLGQFGTGGTTQAPAETPTPGAPAPAGRPPAAASPEFETAITEAHRLYPQVSTTRIKSIIAAESNFDPKAVSPAGAKGPMQLMDGTAKDMGVTDPFDVGQNVRGGTRYYAQLLTKYGGDERKTLTAYNWGPKNLDDAGGDVTKAPAETQRYVARVLGGGGGGGTGTGSSTAQAPAVDPRVAQLDAEIRKGNALALQWEAIGQEGVARQIRSQVDAMQAEKNRLNEPRQKFLEKQAVQDLELQQKREEGLARAQLEADTKPATTGEIDAINRSLPPDKQLPYGTTQKEIRERKLVGREPIAPKIIEDLTTTTTAIQNFEELSNAVTALPTGPLTQYVEAFKERWGIDISDERVAQRAILAGATNQLLTARSGAAITPSEHQRLLNELPNEGNDPKVFKARLANTVRQFKNIYKTKVQILRKTGHAIPDDLMEPLPSPESPPAPKVSSNVDKFRAIKP